MRQILTAIIIGLIIGAGASAAPTVLGAIFRLERLNISTAPAASTFNEGGLLYDTVTDRPYFSDSTSWVKMVAQSDVETQAALNLFVETTGSDSNNCTSVPTACLTIQGALDKVPKRVRHPVTVTVGTGSFTGAQIDGFIINPITVTPGAYIVVQGTLVNATPATGPATGTFTSGTAGVDSTTTWGTATLSTAGWTTNDLRGRWVFITGGTGVGIVRLIADNTATTLTVTGSWGTAPDATSTFEIRESATNITGATTALPIMIASKFDPVRTDPITPNRAFVVSSISSIQQAAQTFPSAPIAIRYFNFSAGALLLNAPGANVIMQANRQSGTTTNPFVRIQGAGVPRVMIYDNDLKASGGGFVADGSIGTLTTAVSRGNIIRPTAAVATIVATGGFLYRSNADYLLNSGGTVSYLTLPSRAEISAFIQGARIDCGGGTSVLFRRNSSTSVSINILGIAVSGSNIDNCFVVFGGRGHSTLFDISSVTGSGNTTVFELEAGAKAQILSTTSITGTTEIFLDGATYTYTQLRGLSPKRLVDASNLSVIMEP